MCAQRFVADGGYGVMIALCKDNSVELQTLAVAALRHLSLDDSLKRGIVQSGLLPVLLRCNAGTGNADLQCQVWLLLLLLVFPPCYSHYCFPRVFVST